MIKDSVVEQKIEENDRSRPWLGIIPVERAIEAAIEYRHSLTGEKQRLFDEVIMNGWLPERAIDMIEYSTEKGLIPEAAQATTAKTS